ncbi:MAG: hypothetical protein ACYDHP_11735, partial [Ferrimicrobium sp.]
IHQPKTSPTPLPAPLHIGTTTYPLNISEIRQIGGHLPESWAKAEAETSTDATTSKKSKASTDTAAPPTPIRPNPKAQRSFTDPDSRMMKTNEGFHFAYNAQAVVDEGSQVIVATKVTQSAGDVNELIPMIEATEASLKTAKIKRSPRVYLADGG